MGEWVTSDRTGALYSWDLVNHTIKKTYQITESKKKHRDKDHSNKDSANTDYMSSKKNILVLVEIEYLKLVAVATGDKQITIYDLNKGEKIVGLNMSSGGVHQMKFFESYQVLLIAGYENTIPIFSITPKYNDMNILGRLVGHLSLVTAIEVVEGSPMVVSGDDNGCLKLWDIRTFHCLQTIELGHKTTMNK
jgi:WD40 repeat protein